MRGRHRTGSTPEPQSPEESLSTNETQVQVKNTFHVVAVDGKGELRGEAKRQNVGHPWIISKAHWRNASGTAEGTLVVAYIEPNVSELLQRKLVIAILLEL